MSSPGNKPDPGLDDCDAWTLNASLTRLSNYSSATDAVPLPQLKPRAMCEHFVVPAIGSRDVACAEWPNIRRFEHFLGAGVISLSGTRGNSAACTSDNSRTGSFGFWRMTGTGWVGAML
jgi:hypothetical protein